MKVLAAGSSGGVCRGRMILTLASQGNDVMTAVLQPQYTQFSAEIEIVISKMSLTKQCTLYVCAWLASVMGGRVWRGWAMVLVLAVPNVKSIWPSASHHQSRHRDWALGTRYQGSHDYHNNLSIHSTSLVFTHYIDASVHLLLYWGLGLHFHCLQFCGKI